MTLRTKFVKLFQNLKEFKAMKKEVNELKELDIFVDMLIDEGVKAGKPFYINI